MASTRDPDDLAGFSEVLAAWSWWDRPRDGSVRIAGRPHRFRCDFEEELDDFPAEYLVWPIAEAELMTDVARWAIWVDWRRRFDRGENPPPVETHPAWQSLVSDASYHAERPALARVAIPDWRLDPDRSFAVRTPRHLVRFVFADDGGPDGL